MSEFSIHHLTVRTILTQGWKVEDQFDTIERLGTNLTQRLKVEDKTVFKPKINQRKTVGFGTKNQVLLFLIKRGEDVVAERFNLWQLLNKLQFLFPRHLVLIYQIHQHSRSRRVHRKNLLLTWIRRRYYLFLHRSCRCSKRHWRSNQHRRRRNFMVLNFTQKPLLPYVKVPVREFLTMKHYFSKSQKKNTNLNQKIKT